ncbi:MAG TPA: LysR family transcriptional regulator [Azospirillaceae bacterium]|nr:LysR family transcriptional regulator [Azospirillaceae bacterium]
MHPINLAAVDLNLLVVFDALMRERHATRAGIRLGLTQPAVSHALGRLRGLFGDELLVRAPGGMVPTPLALGLEPRVREALAQLESLLSRDVPFDPARSDAALTVGMSDYAAFVLLPDLARRLAAQAPRVTLRVRHTSHVLGHDMLDRGEAELIVGSFPAPPARLASEALFAEDFLCVARAGHPAFQAPLTLEAYRALPHLNVSLHGEPTGYVDRMLERTHGTGRRIAVTIGHFLMAPFVVADTDLVATEPRRVVAPLAARLGLSVQEPPVAIRPFAVTMTWHRRLDTDPLHRWLRDLVASAARTV